MLQTKLYVPRLRPSLVPRPRLIDRLNLAIQKKVTLLLAPAGSGKTTLILAWLQQSSQPVAWLALDAQDNDPQRFLAYLLAALQRPLPGLGSSAVALLDALAQGSAGDALEPVLITLLNEIAALARDITLILDDYQVLTSDQIAQIVTFLIDFAPPQLHIILTSRKAPALPLSRWRSRGDLTLIDGQDLRFTPVETAQFLQEVMDLQLAADELEILESRTEGWITGLYLAAISLQKTNDKSDFVAAFGGSDRYVLDYLLDEVLSQQSPGEQSFLQETAVLNRLCAPLCDAVTGRTDSQQMLKKLDDNHLFLRPLDAERRWYRLHTLMRDLLLDRLHDFAAPQLVLLHGRAAHWYAAHKLAEEAIYHALAAGDHELATQLIITNSPHMLRQGRFVTLLDWLKTMPVEYVKHNAQLSVILALARLLAGAFQTLEAVLQPLQDAENALDKVQPATALAGEIKAMRAVIFIESGKSEPGLRLADEAEALLPPANFADHLYLRGMLAMMRGMARRDLGQTETAVPIYEAAVTLNEQSRNLAALLVTKYELSKLWLETGKLYDAEQLHRQTISTLEQRFGAGAAALPLSGAAYIGLGNVLYAWNRLDEAHDCLETGVNRTAQKGGLGINRDGLLTLALIYQAQGNREQADALMAQALDHAQRSPRADAALRAAAVQVRLWLAQGDLTAASRWARQQVIDLEQPTYPAEVTAVALASIYLAQQQPQKTLAILNVYLPFVEAGRRYGRLLEIFLLQALAQQQLNELKMALASLQQCLILAAPQRIMRLFLDVGQALMPLLYTAVDQGLVPEYGGEILALLTAQPDATKPAPPPTQNLIEPLSARELEVLQWVASGLTNRQIGLQLHLSPNTIKRHTLTIYEKLNVHSRTEAVNKARNLGILS